MRDTARIMRDDAKRRKLREIEEWLAMTQNTEQAPSIPNLRGIGIIGKLPVAKASQNNWTTGRNAKSRTVGMAPGANPADGPTYLATYADGTQAILPVPSRKKGSRRNRGAAQVTQAAQLAQDRAAMAAERLAATLAAHAIGNVE